MNRKVSLLIGGASLIGITPGVSAEENQLELDTVVVEASRTEQPITAIPNTITIVDEESIQIQTAINDDVQSILENLVPGFGPSMQKIVGRGESFRGRNPLYLIDGIPQHNPLRDGQRDGHTIDTAFLERIEVIHGSNSVQGIGATGGVVGLVTKSPLESGEWTNQAKLSLTTHDSFDDDGFHYKLSYLGGKKFGKFDFIGGVAYHKRDLFLDANSDPVGFYATQGDIMDSSSKGLFMKFGYEPDSNQRLQLMVNDFKLDADGDYVPVAGDRTNGIPTGVEAGDPRPTRGEPVKNDVTTVSLSYSNDSLYNGILKSQLYYQDFAARYQGGTFGTFYRLTPTGGAFLDQSQIESVKKGAKFSYSVPNFYIKGFQPTLGLDILSDESRQVLTKSGREWVPEMELQSIAPFVQLDHSFAERFHVTAGLRYEQADLKVDDFVTIAAANSTFVTGGEPSYEELLPNFGFTVDIGKGVSAYASYTEGFSMADVGRVLRAINTTGQDVNNIIELEPVITENKEIGINYNFNRGSLHAAYYWSDSDLGSRLEKDANDIFHVMREKTAIQGLELAADFDINDTYTTGMNYTWLKGQFDSDADGSVDSDLDGSNIAPNRLNAYLSANFANGITSRVQLAHLFDRDFDGPGAPTNADFDSYTLVDFYIAKDVGNGELSLAVDNLLDKQYITYFGQTESRQRTDSYFAGNGRTLTLSYQLDF